MSLVNAVRQAFQTNSRAKEHIDWELEHHKKPIRIIGGVGAVVTGFIMLPHAPVLLILAAGGFGGGLALKYGIKALSHAGAIATGFVKGLVSDGSAPQPEKIQKTPKQSQVPERQRPSQLAEKQLAKNFQRVAPPPQQTAKQPDLNAAKRFNPAGPMQWKS